MIRNYLKITWRKLWRNKISSLINLAGLTVGITCCLLMVLYIRHELSYDKFQEKGDRIVRVIMEYGTDVREKEKGNFTSAKVFPAFKANFPEVEDGVRMTMRGNVLVKADGELYTEKRFHFADSTFFDVFSSFKLLQGNPKKVLDAPWQVVLTESTAKRYFGNKEAVGQTIYVSASAVPCLVTGIVADFPSNSQIKADMIGSFSSLRPIPDQTYSNANYFTFLLLKDKASIASLQAKIGPFMKAETKDDPNWRVNFELEPYTSVHLHSPYDGFEPSSNISYIYITAGVALLILIIACFTYINLSTARSIDRAKEVGIRKVAGAGRGQLFWQFVGESAIITILSLLISIALVWLVLPAFNQLAERTLQMRDLATPLVVLAGIGILLSIILLAGSYPALILSKFQPVTVLKGTFSRSTSGNWLRKSLTVFQFGIGAFLVIVTFVMQRQLHYIQNKQLGFDRDHVIEMRIDHKILGKMDLVKNVLKENPDIKVVSRAYDSPVKIEGGYSMSSDAQPGGRQINTRANPVDEDFIKATGLEVIAGSDLSKQDVLDVSADDETKHYYHFILNESAARLLGWTPGEAIGKRMFLDDHRPGEVKGVVRDFHFASMHSAIEPLVIFPGAWGSRLLVKTSGRNIASTISFLESKWKEFAPHRPFDYHFIDEDFNRLYAAELRTGKVFNIFSGIAILLACLGLFGLSVYAVQQRTKEIGIRKVLGASTIRIAGLLIGQFMGLVLIAFLIAAPLAWLSGRRWLQDFAYRTSIEWWMFIVAGAGMVAIATLTVGFRALRAALSKPVTSLRTE